MRTAVPTACLAAALLVAGSAAAQPTPETPGAAGAEAAALALVEAQRAGDWEAGVGLLDPAVVRELGSFTRQFIQDLQRASADTVAQGNASEISDAARVQFLQMARRFRLAVPVEALTDAGIVAGVLAADAPSSYRLSSLQDATGYRVLGSVAEGDSLAHVLVRLRVLNLGDERSVIERATMRWTGTAWVVQIDGQQDAGPLLDYLRFSTNNWIEVVGHIAEEPADAETDLERAQSE